ncbi:MAG: DUF1800 family protein [Tateyamaria sp.]|nr:DUF1800 family protein [Tateyamaria sp.]
MNLARVSRRIGLGAMEEFSSHTNIEGIIKSSLESHVVFKGLPSLHGAIEMWPSEKEFDLNQRIGRLVKRRTESDAIDKRKLSDQEREIARELNWKKFSVDKMDQYRFFHAGQYATNQVKLRLSYFWLNHFTVGAKEVTPQLISDYWENVMLSGLDGTFSDLLYNAITHPAMLTYLDNIYNIGPNSPKAQKCGSKAGASSCVVGLNDNLGRELLELHTVSPLAGYSEGDITNCAKVLAGWGNIFDKNSWSTKPADFRQPWDNNQSEPGRKLVLGKEIPTGKKGLRVLTDFLASHPDTKLFLSKKIITHFCGEKYAQDHSEQLVDLWTKTNGDLKELHSKVIEMSITSNEKVFLWPTTWCFQVARVTGANIAAGFNEIGEDNMRSHIIDPSRIMSEMGHDFWAERQPNGFSDLKDDWISTEHIDRRIRYAGLLFDFGRPEKDTNYIINQHIKMPALRNKLLSIGNERTRFIATLCSPEMMEV